MQNLSSSTDSQEQCGQRRRTATDAMYAMHVEQADHEVYAEHRWHKYSTSAFNFIPRRINWKVRAWNYDMKGFSNTLPMLHYHPSVCLLVFLICLSRILLVLVDSCAGPLDKHKNIKTSLI